MKDFLAVLPVEKNANYQGLMQMLEFMAKHQNEESAAARLLKHGMAYPVGPGTFLGRKGKRHMCFMNAAHKALEGEGTYVEGYVLMRGIPIEHAWVVDEAGVVIETTIPKNMADKINLYYGIPFKREFLIEVLLKTKYYGLLGWLTYDQTNKLLNAAPQEALAA
jgi:hypothetical protein